MILDMDLPIAIDGKKYLGVESYVMSSLMGDEDRRLLLSSYPTNRLKTVFNQQDHEQYLELVYDACNQFNEKKCRSIQYNKMSGNRTIGSLVRDAIKNHQDFVFKSTDANTPFRSVLGVDDVDGVLYGYNLLGHSLLRMKHIVEKLPDLRDGTMEYIFWNSLQKNMNDKDPKTYKAIIPTKKNKNKNKNNNVATTTTTDAAVAPYYYNEDGDFDNDEEEGYDPEEIVVPVYADNGIRWIPTNPNSRLDDLRQIGARADLLYATDANAADPFQLGPQDDITSRTNPLHVFAIFKATEHLVGLMQNGFDIKVFLHKPVNTILAECGITIDPAQRHHHTDYWHKFMSKTIQHYSLIEKEILCPHNLAGFIRKQYATGLNTRIGEKIRELMFASFTYQVIEKSYPDIASDMRSIVLQREMKKFSPQEYLDITDQLYHLFFQGKFMMDEEGVRRVMQHESFRLDDEQIEEALRYTPIKILTKPAFHVNNTILDPVVDGIVVRMDEKEFEDMYQYIYYRLYQFYGGLSKMDAYQLLLDGNQKLLSGTDPDLVSRLRSCLDDRMSRLRRTAFHAKYQQYSQIREMVVFANAIHKKMDNEWDTIVPSPLDLEIMRFVVGQIGKQDQNKAIRLYALFQDVIRSLGIVKSILGRRLNDKSITMFVKCFYPKLGEIRFDKRVPPSKKAPPSFVRLMEETKTLSMNDQAVINALWQTIHPIIFLFQQQSFNPLQLFQEIKTRHISVSKEEMANALTRIINCLYKKDQEIPNDQFYLLVQLMSGKDDIPIWADPSFEMEHEQEEEDKKKKSKKKRVVQYNLIHPSFEPLHTILQKSLHNHGPNVSRASYALDALEKSLIHPRRIVFFAE